MGNPNEDARRLHSKTEARIASRQAQTASHDFMMSVHDTDPSTALAIAEWVVEKGMYLLGEDHEMVAEELGIDPALLAPVAISVK